MEDGQIFDGGSAGILLPDIEAKVLNPEGKVCGPGERGELWLRSECVLCLLLSKRSDMQISSNALGYLGNEKATAESFQDGYFVVRLQET